MSKFPIIFGIIGKKLFLTILLALTLILYKVLKNLIPKKNDIILINNLGGSLLEMSSIFIPCVFKFKGKSENSKRKCTKALFINYFILFLIILSIRGINILIEYLNIKALSVSIIWIGLCFQMIFYIILSIIILKTKYYIHNIISLILFCIFSIINDIILKYFKYIELISFLFLLPNLFEDILCCYMKYLIDKKFHSYWNILFFFGLYYFIIYGIEFMIIIIKDPNNNSIFNDIRNAEIRYIILNFLLDSFLLDFFKMLLTLLILEYFSLNHVLISHVLYYIVFNFINCVSDFNKYKNYLYFIIPAFFQILSILFFVEILEFNFCNLNKNTKRNIILREEEDMLLSNRNQSDIESDIEIDKDLLIKNPQEKKDLELCDIINNSE